MLGFEEFQSFIKENIKDYTGSEYRNAHVELVSVRKNNNVIYHGITLVPKCSNIGPTVYLDEYYDRYTRGRALHDILGDISTVLMVSLEHNISENIGKDFRNVEFVKNRVIMSAIGATWNRDFLSEVPHVIKEDLALILKVLVEADERGISTVTIRNEHMKEWGITEEELFACAEKNSLEQVPASIESMSDYMKSMCPWSDEEIVIPQEMEMYIVSNKFKTNGAASIFYPGVLEYIAETFGTDLYIIPSSVHECLVVSTDMKTPDELLEMVLEVNETMVVEEEQLSNSVYHFDAKEHHFTIAKSRNVISKIVENEGTFNVKKIHR